MRLALEPPYGRYVGGLGFLSRNRGVMENRLGVTFQKLPHLSKPRQRVGVDTIDLHDRGHCVHPPRIMPHLVHLVH